MTSLMYSKNIISLWVLFFIALPAVAQEPEKRIFFRNAPNSITIPPHLLKAVFATDNGSITLWKKGTALDIYPYTVGKCKVWANIAGKTVWEDEFEVRPVPLPSVFLANKEGKEISVKNPLPANVSYQMRIQIDNAYQKNLPNEARYLLSGKLGIYRGSMLVKAIDFQDNEPFNFNALGAKAGDIVLITLQQLWKLNQCHGELTISKPYIQFFLK